MSGLAALPVLIIMSKPIEREGYSIVMADDDIDDQALVKQAFRNVNVNHVFTSVYNGVQLMEFLLKRGSYRNAVESPPDLIIMDIRMNLLDGFETISTLRNYKELQKIPIYILSNSSNAEDRDRGRQLGVRAFYSKPDNPDEWPQITRNIFKDLAVVKNEN